MHQSPIKLMEGDGAEGDSKPPAEEGGVDGEVQVELSQQPPQLEEEVEMALACDPVCDKELQSVEDSTGLKSIPIGYKEKTTDGYNWRKYGQKQVKNPEGSRGYYRCTLSNCSAKKIEYFDRSHRVTYIVYKTHHSHDPSEKVHCDIEHNRPSPSMRENGIDDITRPVSCSKEPSPKNDRIIETKQHDLSGPDETTDSKFEIAEVRKDETMEKRSLDSEMGSLPENGKTRKFIFRETIADASIRGDGYKWRKYGQKTVKGTPHPRNYYKCTSSGCPVRKHIEKATDNTCSVIVTYKGVHDHDLPVPKKTVNVPSHQGD